MSMNKAQTGKKVTKKPVKKTTPHPNDTYKGMVDPATGKKGTMGGEGTRPPFTREERKKMPRVGSMGSAKNGKIIKKAKSGGKFPDLNKDGKITKADILKGRGVIAKKGVAVKKAQDGYTGKQNRLARQEKRVYNRYTDAKASGNIKKSGRLYDKLIDKQTKSIKAGVDVQYKSGGSMKKCKYGCK